MLRWFPLPLKGLQLVEEERAIKTIGFRSF